MPHLIGGGLLWPGAEGAHEAALRDGHDQAQEGEHAALGKGVVAVLVVRHEGQRELQARVEEEVEKVDSTQLHQLGPLCRNKVSLTWVMLKEECKGLKKKEGKVTEGKDMLFRWEI